MLVCEACKLFVIRLESTYVPLQYLIHSKWFAHTHTAKEEKKKEEDRRQQEEEEQEKEDRDQTKQ